jgi:RIO-like serine/threonine protein kinase
VQSAIKEMRVSRKRFSEQDIWLILTQGLLVLCELEKYSVVHCNISSHSVYLTENGELQITHFENSLSLLEYHKVNIMKFGQDSGILK